MEYIRRMRFQAGGGVVAAVLFPLVIYFLIFQPGLLSAWLVTPNVINTTALNMTAMSIGFFFWKQIDRFPAVTGGIYVLWSYLPSYLLTTSVLVLTRAEYSRTLIFISFIMCIIWFVSIQIIHRRYFPSRFVTVPGGRVENAFELPNVSWYRLKKKISQPHDILSAAEAVNGQSDKPNRYNGLVVDLDADLDPEYERLIANSVLSGIPVYNYQSMSEKISGRVKIDRLSENEFGTVLPDSLYLKLKRVIDLVGVLVALPFLIAAFIVISLTILIRDGRPIFFLQKRKGFRGKNFTAFKFRTMVNSTPQLRPGGGPRRAVSGLAEMPQKSLDNEVVALNGGEVIPEITQKDDARITKTGRFLRKSRLDELPQVINIVLGDMSWIGPRPEAIVLSEDYQQALPFYIYRHAVRPGITGWAQVNLGHVTDIEQIDKKLSYDFFYIKNVSLWLDILIALKTIRVMATGLGAK